MTHVYPYPEPQVANLVIGLGEVVLGSSHVKRTIGSFDPNDHRIPSGVDENCSEMPKTPELITESVRRIAKRNNMHGFVAVAYKANEWLLGWAGLRLETGELSYFYYPKALSNEAVVGYCGCFIEKGTKDSRDGLCRVPNVLFFDYPLVFDEITIEEYPTSSIDGRLLSLIQNKPIVIDERGDFKYREQLGEYFDNNFSSLAIVEAGRKLASLTSSDVTKHYLSDDRLETIVRLANDLAKRAQLALDIRDFDKSLD